MLITIYSIKMLENIIPINIYGSDWSQIIDNNEIAKIQLKHKIFNNLDVYYVISHESKEVIDLIYKVKLNLYYAFIPYLYNILKEKLLKKLINNEHSYVILFVPSDPKRFIERGFGFNEEIMKLAIEDKFNIKDVITKRKYTPNQSKLKTISDRKNIPDLYFIDDRDLEELDKYDIIYLYDDFITTGSTVTNVLEDTGINLSKVSIISFVGE
jgi:predicted amidophosphoribosyltransferase